MSKKTTKLSRQFNILTRKIEGKEPEIERETEEKYLKRWKKIPIGYDMPDVQISLLERLNYWISLGSKYTILIITFIKIIIGLQMNNDKKTTILGYVKAGLFIVAGALLLFGLVPESLLTTLGGAGTWTGIGAVIYGIIDAVFGKNTNKPDDNTAD